jgi:pimeloyl-ACP methyl ester carboxylesterase
MAWQLLVRQNNELSEGDTAFREWNERASAQEIADGLSDLGPLREHEELWALVDEELRNDLPVPARDPFLTWAPRAVENFNQGLANVGRAAWDPKSHVLSWHGADQQDISEASDDPTAMVLVAEPGRDYLLRYSGPTHHADWETTFKYVAYWTEDEDEDGSLYAVAGESPMSSILAAEFTVPRGLSPSLIVGRVVRRTCTLFHRASADREDPAFVGGARERDYLQHKDLGALATSCPRLDRFEGGLPRGSEPTVVFVHGTASTCVKYLPSLASLKGRLLRFEHDTYRPITANATTLFELVRDRLHGRDVVLLGHSRGGLVARRAAGLLHPQRCIDLITLGTPHEGTALISAGRQAMNAGFARRTLQRRMWKTGRRLLARQLAGAHTDELVSELLSHRDLPRGWLEMEPGARTLDEISSSPAPCRFASVGAIAKDKSGRLSRAERLLLGLVLRWPHDMVVTYRSATSTCGGGVPTLAGLHCDHGEYFEQREVTELIESF